MILPVDVAVKRYYRVYVNVQNDSPSQLEVEEAVKKYMNNVGIDESDADPCMDIEEADLLSVEPDYDGIMFDDEE